jgi:hypothetical protein
VPSAGDPHAGQRTSDDRCLLTSASPDALTVDQREMAAKALELLADGEIKLLSVYDARQASADSRTTALATAAVALPTLILSLSKALTNNGPLLWVGYALVILAAAVVIGVRAWGGWRRRRTREDGTEPDHHKVGAEALAVKVARRAWRTYQQETAVANADPIRVRQLALDMWRTRANDSHNVAQIKDKLSVAAAAAFLLALILSALLVAYADFGTT